MQSTFLTKLEDIRVDWGIPLSPTSGQRCEFWNDKIGGSPKSQHLIGNAADFWFSDPQDAEDFVLLSEKHGFGGIGAGKHLVHIDNRDGRARWTYDD